MMMTTPLHADPSVGFGLSVSYGQQGVDVGLGVRVFSDDTRDSDVASIGLDYMLASQSWRATVGVAHLANDAYVGIDLGLDVYDGSFSLGLGLGKSKTRSAPDNPPAIENESDDIQETPDPDISDSFFDQPPPAYYAPPVFIDYPDNFIPEREVPNFPWQNGDFNRDDFDFDF
jgi:hypothetical protein